MKTLLVQLSDIHFKGENDPILNKTDELVSAISAEIVDDSFIILTFTGDIAFSGDELEYVIAADWIKSITKKLFAKNSFIKGIKQVFVPGNHDCDFRTPQTARNLIIKNIHKESVTTDIVEICTSVQSTFFDFIKEITGESIAGLDQMFYSITIDVAGSSFVFNCINTAWVSQKNETHGSMYFPTHLINTKASKTDISITLFHHPYNWIMEMNNRDFRKAIEDQSDILMSGHEHDPSIKRIGGMNGEITEYFEGGALQDSSDPDNSGFNLIFIDPENQQQKIVIYKWEKNHYITAYRSQSWEEFQGNKLRKKRSFEITKSHLEWLENPGVNINHPIKGNLKLEDFFAYPDLRESSYGRGETNSILQGDELLEQIISLENLLITAPEQGGKTGLAKTLYKDFLKKGLVPILLLGQSFRARNNEQVVEYFISQAEEQYEGDITDKFKQLDHSQRVLIIDSFHKLKIARGYEREFLSLLEAYFGKVILLSNDIAQQINEITDAKRMIEERASFRTFRILPFGYVRRNVLIEKWLLLDSSLQENDELLASKLLSIERTVDTIVGKNFVPAFPIIILSILQNNDSITPIDVSASTYGYFYELFIRNALANGSTKIQFDVKIAYLSYVAYKMFSLKVEELPEDQFEEIHREYEVEYDLRISYDSIKAELEKCLILIKIGDTYEFKYKYMYYYFVAKYLNDFISIETVREKVKSLCHNLYIEDYANILLFLAHLSRDPFIISEMTTAAKNHFKNDNPANLDKDLEFLQFNDPKFLANSSKELTVEYVEKDIVENRKERLLELDNIENGQNEIENEPSEHNAEEFEQMSQYAKELGGAFRTLQILGQILKNFPGSLPASQKLEIAKECYELGLRSLGNMLSLLSENRDDIIRYVVELQRTDEPNFTNDELLQRAKQSILGLTQTISYSTVKRIAASVGSPSLTETYNRLVRQYDTPAIHLIHTSLQLDHSASFPQTNLVQLGKALDKKFIPLSILRHMVVNHFHLFPVHFQSKQKVCEGLGIPYKRLQSTNPKARLTK